MIQKTGTTDNENFDDIKNDILSGKRLSQIANENKYGIGVTRTAANIKSENEDYSLPDQKKRLM